MFAEEVTLNFVIVFAYNLLVLFLLKHLFRGLFDFCNNFRYIYSIFHVIDPRLNERLFLFFIIIQFNIERKDYFLT